MTIQKIRTSSRKQWLALRQQDVTASVAGALLGVDPYTTPYGLWAVKSGAAPADTAENDAMERGRRLEPVAVDWLRERHPKWQITHNRGGRQVYYRDPAARIGATPDVIAAAPDRPFTGVVQVKTAGGPTFRAEWIAEDGEIRPPLWIRVQAIVEAHLTGAAWAMVVVLVVDSYRLEFHEVEIPVHAGVIDRIRAEVAEFWRRVGERDPYPIDHARDGAVLARVFARSDRSEIDLSGDNEIPGLLAARTALRRAIAANATRVDEIDTEIKAKLGSAEVAYIGGGRRIVWREQTRTGFSVPPKTIRVLRVPEIEDG